MVKLYFKQLLFTLLLVVIFALSGAICVFLWHLIFRNLIPESARDIVCAILGGLISFKLLFTFRCKNSPIKSAYVNSFTEDTFSFVKDFKNTFISKDNLVHLLAFITLDLIYSVAMAISVNTTFVRFIIVTMIYLLRDCLIFAILNTLVWCLVHKKWMRFLELRNT